MQPSHLLRVSTRLATCLLFFLFPISSRPQLSCACTLKGHLLICRVLFAPERRSLVASSHLSLNHSGGLLKANNTININACGHIIGDNLPLRTRWLSLGSFSALLKPQYVFCWPCGFTRSLTCSAHHTATPQQLLMFGSD